MRSYQLYVKVDGAWSWVCTIDAPTHADAFRKALRRLGPEDRDRPIRFEQDTEGAYRKPVQPKRRPSAAVRPPDHPDKQAESLPVRPDVPNVRAR